MAYVGSKGWYVQQLKENGYSIHPTGRRKLESYKTSVLHNLYKDLVVSKK
ncbi:DUF2639 domain-containing protein [Litchfieldia alkalitelluris]|nr:DUF2639 domain-containing protein [Litchfieldia alkalitelluris]